MTPRDHIAELNDWLRTADEKRRQGKWMQESECLWCAVKHAIDAVAMLNNRNPDRERRIRFAKTGNKEDAMRYIARLNPDYPHLFDGFEAARKWLHPYSEHRHIGDADLEIYQAQARQLVADLLVIADRMAE